MHKIFCFFFTLKKKGLNQTFLSRIHLFFSVRWFTINVIVYTVITQFKYICIKIQMGRSHISPYTPAVIYFFIFNPI